MKFKKRTLLLATLISTIFLSNNFTQSALNQEARTIIYKDNQIDENTLLSEFDNHQIEENKEGLTILADKSFNSDILDDLDLVGFNSLSSTFSVNYQLNYIEKEDTVFLNVTLNDNDLKIVDNIPGLPTINNKGESDIIFSIENELIYLSSLIDEDKISNTGWFTNLIKKFVDTTVNAISTVVKKLEPIIKPAVKISSYFAIRLIGKDNAASIGAKILNMKKDEQGIYHADFDCWQQYFGYSDLYDVVFDSATSMRYGKFDFDINNDLFSDYILWAWKGDYLNLGAGAELGIYTRWKYSDTIWKVDKSKAMKMTLKLNYKNKTLFDYRPIEKQWWITGFDYKTQNVDRDDLTATFTVKFNDYHMYRCFKEKYNKSKEWNFSTYMKPTLTL